MRLLLALLLGIPSLASAAPTPFASQINEFCGIRDSVSASKLPPCFSPDAENVLTDRGRLEPMWGMTVLASVIYTGYPVKNIWQFQAPDGTDYLVAHSSDSIYKTDLSATPSVVEDLDEITDVDAVSAFGKQFFVDGTNTGWWWDGTSTGAVSAMPLAEYIDFEHERLVVANTSVSGSQVAVSSFGSFSWWTVPADVADVAEAPNSFTFNNGDGEEITCLKSTPWGIFVGKPHSTHILKGFDNETFYKRLVAEDIGCVDDRLVQLIDGALIWLSYDGVYVWAGSDKPKLISGDINERIKTIRQITAQADSWAVNQDTDWDNGVIESSGPAHSGPTPAWDLVTNPGDIFPSTVTFVDSSTQDFVGSSFTFFQTTWTVNFSSVTLAIATGTIVEGTFATTATWTFNGTLAQNPDAVVQCVSANNPGFNCACDSGLTYPCMWMRIGSTANSASNSYRFRVLNGATNAEISSQDPGCDGQFVSVSKSIYTTSASTAGIRLEFYVEGQGGNRSVVTSTQMPAGFTATYSCRGDRGAGAGDPTYLRIQQIQISSYPETGTLTRFYDTRMSTPTYDVATVSFSSDSMTGLKFDTRSSGDGISWSNWLSMSLSSPPVNVPRRYLELRATFSNVLSGTTTARIDEMTFGAVSSGTYYSDVHFVGTDISSWKTADFEDTVSPSGLLTYQVRSSTNIFTILSTTPTWVTQTNHGTISASTGSYAQFRVLSTVIRSSQTASISRATLNWKEGEAPRAASVVDDHRYLMCVSVGAGSLQNDSCEVWQKNGLWTRLTGKNISSMARFDNKPIAGDGSTTSAVWKIMQEGVYNYGGSAISSYWKTPYLTLGNPNSDKTIQEIWLEAEESADSDVDVAYAVNKSTSFISETIDLETGTGYVNEQIPFDAGFERARYHQFKISNSDLDDDFRIDSVNVYGTLEDRY